MRQPLIAGTLLGLLAACGGGGGAPTQTPIPPPAPAWRMPVDVAGSTLASGAHLAGDGKGGAVAAWTRMGVDAGGAPIWEQVAARLHPDGTWEAPQALDTVSGINGFQPPVAALGAPGRGRLAWFKAVSGQPGAVLVTVPVDLGAAAPFGPRTEALTVGLSAPTDLRLAAGSDGSALAAWRAARDFDEYRGLPTVQSSRLAPGGGWSAPASHALNPLSGQFLRGLAGDGLGGYALEMLSGDDATPGSVAVTFGAGSGGGTVLPGWEPTGQEALPAHVTAWAADGQGRLEAWLRYDLVASGDPLRQVWPRLRDASGSWTLAGPVALPLPAASLAVFREGSGGGWLAGLGGQGLWVAPLEGRTPGVPRTILPAPTATVTFLGTRDTSGRPALLWIQRGSGGTAEGIGFSRWDGSAWTSPEILPGTAGRTLGNLMAVAGPSGLLAGWVEAGDRVQWFQTALWR